MSSNPKFHISVWSSEEMAYQFLNQGKSVDGVVPKLYVLSLKKYKSSSEFSEHKSSSEFSGRKKTGDRPAGVWKHGLKKN